MGVRFEDGPRTLGRIRTADMSSALARLDGGDVGPHAPHPPVASALQSLAMHAKVLGWSGVGGSLNAHN